MSKEKITKDISIEELTEEYPFSVNFLSRKGIRCIVCGEPIWGTLEEAALEKGFDNKAIEGFVNELNELNENFEKGLDENMNSLNIDKLDV